MASKRLDGGGVPHRSVLLVISRWIPCYMKSFTTVYHNDKTKGFIHRRLEQRLA